MYHLTSKYIGLEKQQKNSTYIICVMLPNSQEYVEEAIALSQNIPKYKITHADLDHLFLAITENWAMRLFVGVVMQGHI